MNWVNLIQIKAARSFESVIYKLAEKAAQKTATYRSLRSLNWQR